MCFSMAALRGTKVQYAKIWTDSELTCAGQSILPTFIFVEIQGSYTL